jgi:hypothetical protein
VILVVTEIPPFFTPQCKINRCTLFRNKYNCICFVLETPVSALAFGFQPEMEESLSLLELTKN